MDNWKEKISRSGYWNETGIYHVDGGEYNVYEERLISFIDSLLHSDREQLIRRIEENKKVLSKSTFRKLELQQMKTFNQALDQAISIIKANDNE